MSSPNQQWYYEDNTFGQRDMSTGERYNAMSYSGSGLRFVYTDGLESEGLDVLTFFILKKEIFSP